MAWALMVRAVGHEQRTGCTRGMNQIALVTRRDVKVGEAEKYVMQSRSIRRSGQPISASASQNAG